MAQRQLAGVIQYLRRIVAGGDAAHVSDGQLLERFVTQRDETAFELLVWRHSKMVLGVCRRLLHDAHAAEDAFQASFLALARRASSISKRASVSGWLYQVAYRVALEAKAQANKRATHEHPLPDQPALANAPDPSAEAAQRELRRAIDDEVNRLPEKYRVPFVLCYFEGKSNGEAACELGCPVGTVESWLARARERLRHRLARRGFLPSVGLSALVLSESTASAWVSTPLVLSTVKVATAVVAGQAAAGAISAEVAALTEAVLRAMWITQLRIVVVAVVVSLLGSGVGLFTHLAWGEKSREVAQENPKPAASDSKQAQAPALPQLMAMARNFETTPGYAWAIAPPQRPIRGNPGGAWAEDWGPAPQPGLPADAGICAIVEKDKDGGLVIILARPPSTNNALPDYRPVAFDTARKRYPLKVTIGVGTATATLARYYLDPKILPAKQVTHLGIEVLTPGGPKAIAKLAAERAQKAGVEVPSFPQIGETYDFALTTTDDQKIRARDFRGKVVLLDCWATWCSPCMALLPEIKELYENRHEDGLEVIGINFDHDAEKAKKTCKLLGLPWPQVIVPTDEATRQLWQEASGIGGLPRVFLIDREGILRADQAYELDKAVAKLLKRPSEKPKEESQR